MCTEARLRTTSFASESKLMKSVRSPRKHAASVNAPLKVDFAVPGKPVIRNPGSPVITTTEHDIEALNPG